MPDPLLSVENLTVERGGRTVLSSLSFALDAGETLLVSGRNGAGKSTLLRTLCGFLPARAGRIRFGLASEEMRGVETVHYLGYEDALKPALTVRENLEFWAAMLGRRPGAAEPRPEPIDPSLDGQARSSRIRGPHSANAGMTTHDALAALGIARLIDLPAGYLSAGQKRRVALARLLLAPRPLWLLDEPLIALDTAAQATLAAIMAGHVAAGGAILLASHQAVPLPHREIDLGARPVT